MRKNLFDKKEVILDFDYTLFDTARFKRALARSLVQFGVTNSLFFKLYPLAVHKHDGEYSYSTHRHLRLLMRKLPRLSLLIGQRELDSVVRHSYLYLYPTTVRFLTDLKRAGFNLVLVTHGDEEFQGRKILYSRIKRYFSQVIISKEFKVLTLRKLLDNFSQSFFVSDHAIELKHVKRQLPNLFPIMKLATHSNRNIAHQLGVPAFRSLTEIEKYIRNYYKKQK